MSEQREVPGQPSESGERMQSRDAAEDFATLPDAETHANTQPGGGPDGTVTTGGTNLPVVVIGLGVLIVFSTFLLRSPWALGIGLVVVLAGAIWAGLANASAGAMGGLGTTEVDDRH
ncbi:MAG: hypothetical protein ACR2MA_07845 [Egibacteraceae bacterium]